MNDLEFENRVRSLAGSLDYPRTPDIAGFITARLEPTTNRRFISKGLSWSLSLIVIFLFSLFLIPPVRAAILDFIEIGIVRVFPRPAETSPQAPRTATPVPPLGSSELLLDLSRLAGETTLGNAVNSVPYSILVPVGFGEPDHIFVQDVEGFMTVLVWLDSNDSAKVLMSLHFIPEGSWAVKKLQPTIMEEVEVRGQRALWTVGPYFLIFSNGNTDLTRMLNGHVLIWEEKSITYRLESNFSLEEAMRVAESLEPIP